MTDDARDSDAATRATAFVPGHVTAFFAPYPDDDPAQAGATGAGLALADGIRTTVEPLPEDVPVPSETLPHRITLDGDSAAIDPVLGVIDALDVPSVLVRIESDVPIGAGFGVSGGAALGTALAANDVFDLAYTENELVALAHAAEVRSGTGLGDVVGAFRGGLPLRLLPGDPEHGRFDGIPATPRVEYVSFGQFSTADVLADDTSQVTAAGEAALERVTERPTVAELLAAAREFAVETELLDGEVQEAVDAVDAAGGRASMAMLGRTVFAPGSGLSDAGYDPEVCEIHSGGATLEKSERMSR
jgi:pantoate kinase